MATTAAAMGQNALQEEKRKKEVVLNELMKELIRTEKTYVEKLQHILQHVMQPLASIGINHPVAQQMLQLLQPIGHLLGNHTQFLKALTEAVSTENTLEQNFHNFAGVMKTYAPSFGQAADYIASHSKLNKLVQQFLTTVKQGVFKNFCQQLETNTGFQLDALLIVPVQRVPRYQLFAEEMIKNNVFENLNAELQEVLQIIQKSGHEMNEHNRQCEQDVVTLRQKLVSCSAVVSDRPVNSWFFWKKSTVQAQPVLPAHENVRIISYKKNDDGQFVTELSDIIERLLPNQKLQSKINDALHALGYVEVARDLTVQVNEDLCFITVIVNEKKHSYTLKKVEQGFDLEIDFQEGMHEFSDKELCCIWTMRDEIAKQVAAPLGWVKTSRVINYSAALQGKIKSEPSDENEDKIIAERRQSEEKVRVEEVKVRAEAGAVVLPRSALLRPEEEVKEGDEEDQAAMAAQTAEEGRLLNQVFSSFTAPLPLSPEVDAQPVTDHFIRRRVAPPPPPVRLQDNKEGAEISIQMMEIPTSNVGTVRVSSAPIHFKQTIVPPIDFLEEQQIFERVHRPALVEQGFVIREVPQPAVVSPPVAQSLPAVPARRMPPPPPRGQAEAAVSSVGQQGISAAAEVPQPAVVSPPVAQSLSAVPAGRIPPPPPPRRQEVAAVSSVGQQASINDMSAFVSGDIMQTSQNSRVVPPPPPARAALTVEQQAAAAQQQAPINDMSVFVSGGIIRTSQNSRVVPPPPPARAALVAEQQAAQALAAQALAAQELAAQELAAQELAAQELAAQQAAARERRVYLERQAEIGRATVAAYEQVFAARQAAQAFAAQQAVVQQQAQLAAARALAAQQAFARVRALVPQQAAARAQALAAAKALAAQQAAQALAAAQVLAAQQQAAQLVAQQQQAAQALVVAQTQALTAARTRVKKWGR